MRGLGIHKRIPVSDTKLTLGLRVCLILLSLIGAVSAQPGIDRATLACEATTFPMRPLRV